MKIIVARQKDSKNGLHKFGNTIFTKTNVNFVSANIKTKKWYFFGNFIYLRYKLSFQGKLSEIYFTI